MRTPTTYLFALLKSLSTKERARVRKDLKDNQSSGDWSLDLFNFLNKQEEYDHAQLLARFPDKSPGAISNRKVWLFDRICQSLIENGRYLDVSNRMRELRERLGLVELLQKRNLIDPALREIEKAIEIAREIESFDDFVKLLDLKGFIIQEKYGGEELLTILEEIANEKQRCYSYMENLLAFQRLESLVEAVTPDYDDNSKTKLLLTRISTNELLDDYRAVTGKAKIIQFRLRRWVARTKGDYQSMLSLLLSTREFFEKNRPLLNDSRSLASYVSVIYQSGMLYSYFGEFENAKKALSELNQVGKKRDSVISGWLPWGKQKTLELYIAGKSKDRKLLESSLDEILRKTDRLNQVSNRERVVLLYKTMEVLVILGRYREALNISRLLGNDNSPIRRDLVEAARIIELLIFYTTGNDLLEDRISMVKEEVTEEARTRFEFIFHFLESVFQSDFDSRPKLEKEFQLKISDKYLDKITLEYFDFKWWIKAKIENKIMWETTKN